MMIREPGMVHVFGSELYKAPFSRNLVSTRVCAPKSGEWRTTILQGVYQHRTVYQVHAARMLLCSNMACAPDVVLSEKTRVLDQVPEF